MDRAKAERLNGEGIAKAQAGEVAEARRLFLAAVEADPSYHEAHGNAGNTWMQEGDMKSAGEAYDRALGLEPAHAESLWGRMNARRVLRQFGPAADDAEVLLAGGGAERLGVEDSVRESLVELKLLRRMAAFQPQPAPPPPPLPEEAREFLEKALDAMRRDDTSAALGALEAAVERAPGHAALYSNRAAIHLTLRRLPEAAEDCQRALALDPEDLLAYGNRAGVRRLLGDPLGAVEDLDRVLAGGRREAGVLIQRAWGLKDLGRLGDALADFDEALRNHPTHPQAHYGRGLVLNAMGRIDHAAKAYDAALDADPKLTDAYAARALARAALGRPREGAEDLKRYLELGDGRAMPEQAARSFLHALGED